MWTRWRMNFIIISYIFWKVARRFAEGYYLYNQIHRFVIPWYCLGLKFPAPLWQLAATLKVPRPKTVGTKTAVVNQSNSFGLLFFCWQVRIPCSLLWIQRQRERRCKTASASVPSLSTFIDLDFRQEGANGRFIRLWGHPIWHMTNFILVFFPACIPQHMSQLQLQAVILQNMVTGHPGQAWSVPSGTDFLWIFLRIEFGYGFWLLFLDSSQCQTWANSPESPDYLRKMEAFA